MRLAKVLKVIGGFVFVLGLFSVPGVIEFGEGLTTTLILLIAGAILALAGGGVEEGYYNDTDL